MPLDRHEPGRGSGSRAEPHNSPPVIATASSHGPARIPSCSRHARTALPSASTASPNGEPAGRAGAGAGSSARTHRSAAAHSVSARRAPARSHPRTVDGARPRRVAIVRCPCPCALATNAWPITSAPSRRRGTEQASSSTCVVSHPPHRARRGRNRRTPSSIRTSRSRANPQRDSGRSHPGQHNRPAARSASSTSGFTVIDNNSGRHPHEHTHKRSTAPDRREGFTRVGRTTTPQVSGRNDSQLASSCPYRRPRPGRETASQAPSGDFTARHHHGVVSGPATHTAITTQRVVSTPVRHHRACRSTIERLPDSKAVRPRPAALKRHTRAGGPIRPPCCGSSSRGRPDLYCVRNAPRSSIGALDESRAQPEPIDWSHRLVVFGTSLVPGEPQSDFRYRHEMSHLQEVIGARPERFELPTFGSVDRRSIQLSYGRLAADSSFRPARSQARRRQGRRSAQR